MTRARPASRGLVATLLVTLSAGCPPSLDRFHVGTDDAAAPGDAAPPVDGSAPSVDGAGAIDGPLDGPAPPDGAVAPDLAAPPCPLPQLLVSVENLNGGSTGGRVLRYALLADGTSQRCADLGGTELPFQPLAVAALPSGRVGAATTDGAYWIDAASNQVVGSVNLDPTNHPLPVDAFALTDPATGHSIFAVAYVYNGISCIGDVLLYDTVTSTTRTMSTSGLLSCSSSMSADPFDPHQLLALDGPNGVAAVAIDPFSSTKGQTYATASGESLLSVYSFAQPMKSLTRTAWVDRPSAGSDRVAYDNDTGGGTVGLSFAHCAGSTATLLHAVPDPHPDFYSFFALTDAATIEGRTILHFSSTTTCDTLLDGATLGTRQRISRLAVALP